MSAGAGAGDQVFGQRRARSARLTYGVLAVCWLMLAALNQFGLGDRGSLVAAGCQVLLALAFAIMSIVHGRSVVVVGADHVTYLHRGRRLSVPYRDVAGVRPDTESMVFVSKVMLTHRDGRSHNVATNIDDVATLLSVLRRRVEEAHPRGST